MASCIATSCIANSCIAKISRCENWIVLSCIVESCIVKICIVRSRTRARAGTAAVSLHHWIHCLRLLCFGARSTNALYDDRPMRPDKGGWRCKMPWLLWCWWRWPFPCPCPWPGPCPCPCPSPRIQEIGMPGRSETPPRWNAKRKRQRACHKHESQQEHGKELHVFASLTVDRIGVNLESWVQTVTDEFRKYMQVLGACPQNQVLLPTLSLSLSLPLDLSLSLSLSLSLYTYMYRARLQHYFALLLQLVMRLDKAICNTPPNRTQHDGTTPWKYWMFGPLEILVTWIPVLEVLVTRLVGVNLLEAVGVHWTLESIHMDGTTSTANSTTTDNYIHAEWKSVLNSGPVH